MIIKEDQRRLCAAAQEAVRLRAVRAVEAGMTRVEAAERFGVSRQSVGEWVRRYREGGVAVLRSRQRGRPAGSRRLKGRQSSIIAKLICERHPEQLKLPFVLWTRQAVGELILERFGIDYSLSTVGRLLKRWGFTPQKPVRRAFEQDREAVRRWLEVRYPAVAREAKRRGAQIHWGDEMGMRSDHQTGRSYSPKGKTPVIPGTGQRFSCNMISTITNRGELRFMVFQGRFTAPVFIEFLRRLVKQTQRIVYLIVDGHPVHKARKVKQWLEANQTTIRVFLLPTYSPDLNPDEFLNNDVKSNAVGRRRPSNRDELIADVRSYLRSTQQQPHIVTSYFDAQSVQYARA